MSTRVPIMFVAALWVSAALEQVSPPAVIEPVIHSGDPDVSCDLDGNAVIDGGDIEMFVELLGA